MMRDLGFEDLLVIAEDLGSRSHPGSTFGVEAYERR